MRQIIISLLLSAIVYSPSIASFSDEESIGSVGGDNTAQSRWVGNLLDDSYESPDIGRHSLPQDTPKSNTGAKSLSDKADVKILTFSSMESDLRAVKRPSFLYFHTQASSYYKLCDPDGGATLAFLYATCMSDLQERLYARHLEAPVSSTDSLEDEPIEKINLVRTLFNYTLARFIAIHESMKDLEMDSLRALGRRLSYALRTDQILTYRLLDDILGSWLRRNYVNLKDYLIDVTYPELKRGGVIKGIQYRRPGTLGWSPLGNVLHHYCTSNLKSITARNRQDYFLDTSLLPHIMKAYDVQRAFDQKLRSDYKVIRTTMLDPTDGTVVVIEKFIPVSEDPKVAVPKSQTAWSTKAKGISLKAKDEPKAESSASIETALGPAIKVGSKNTSPYNAGNPGPSKKPLGKTTPPKKGKNKAGSKLTQPLPTL